MVISELVKAWQCWYIRAWNRKSREGLVWVESDVGRMMMAGVMYVNSEGVRVRETERLFEVLQVDVVKYGEKGFDVIVMW